MTEHSSDIADILSTEAWRILSEDPDAVLVDVRTEPEWSFVGVPDLGPLGRQPVFVSWQGYPDLAVNEHFVDDVRAHGVAPSQPVLLICRSGARSAAAAAALRAAGFERCYNVADGFEGPPDDQRHRSVRAGWKVAGLPWVQG